jgi:hypothetical protein
MLSRRRGSSITFWRTVGVEAEEKRLPLCWGGKEKLKFFMFFAFFLFASSTLEFIVANDMQRMKRRHKNVS